MKILKIALLLLIPAFGIVSCDKSAIHPKCSEDKATSTQSDDISARSTLLPVENEDKGSTIVGSGDDDRDGGDKKQKR